MYYWFRGKLIFCDCVAQLCIYISMCRYRNYYMRKWINIHKGLFIFQVALLWLFMLSEHYFLCSYFTSIKSLPYKKKIQCRPVLAYTCDTKAKREISLKSRIITNLVFKWESFACLIRSLNCRKRMVNYLCSLLIVDIFSKVGSYDIGKIHGFSIKLSKQ